MKFNRKWTIEILEPKKDVNGKDRYGLKCDYTTYSLPPAYLGIGDKLTLDVSFNIEEILELVIEKINNGEIKL